jgi:hypothetical protein
VAAIRLSIERSTFAEFKRNFLVTYASSPD